MGFFRAVVYNLISDVKAKKDGKPDNGISFGFVIWYIVIMGAVIILLSLMK